jgi:hypothetical protein
MRAACDLLDERRAEVDALNVFPVPDGDTGTNMSLTLRSAMQEMDGSAPAGCHFAQAAEAAALGSLMGARGNSGVILSQILRGFAQGVQGAQVLDAAGLAGALQEGVVTAYQAVMRPVEGTILTVAREAARGALDEARRGGDVVAVLAAAVRRAEYTLERTPELLPVLRRAGVVDAGGKGLVFILRAAVETVAGERWVEAGAAAEVPAGPTQEAVAEAADLSHPYDVQFLLRGADMSQEKLREEFEPRGDSLLVVGTPSLIKVHVHTAEPHVVLGLAMAHGELDRVEIINMRQQHEEFKASRGGARSGAGDGAGDGVGDGVAAAGGGAVAARAPSTAAPGTQSAAGPQPHVAGVAGMDVPERGEEAASNGEGPAVICVAPGRGLGEIFFSLGAAEVIAGGQTMNPSTQDILGAIERVGAQKIIVLPNNPNIIPAAEQAAKLTSKKVYVVPSRTVPQGIAALVAMRPRMEIDDNIEVMRRAMTMVKTGMVTFAVRDAKYRDMSITSGTILGLHDGDIKATGQDRHDVALRLVTDMAGPGTEVITLFYGEDVSGEEAAALASAVQGRHEGHEVELRFGGQPHYYYIISVE